MKGQTVDGQSGNLNHKMERRHGKEKQYYLMVLFVFTLAKAKKKRKI